MPTLIYQRRNLTACAVEQHMDALAVMLLYVSIVGHPTNIIWERIVSSDSREDL